MLKITLFRCPGRSRIVETWAGWEDGMYCKECQKWQDTRDESIYDDSWGDHNPYYDY